MKEEKVLSQKDIDDFIEKLKSQKLAINKELQLARQTKKKLKENPPRPAGFVFRMHKAYTKKNGEIMYKVVMLDTENKNVDRNGNVFPSSIDFTSVYDDKTCRVIIKELLKFESEEIIEKFIDLYYKSVKLKKQVS